VVRRPAALLAALAAAIAWFLVAPSLPEIHGEDASLLVAATLGFAFVAACVMAIVPLAQARLAFVLVLPGAALLMAALNAADVGAGATPVEAVVWASVGCLFAVALGTPALALALPVVAAGIDVASTLAASGDGPARAAAGSGDALALDLPDIGSGLSAGTMGPDLVVFFAIFVVFAQRLGLRGAATAVAMVVALSGVFAAELMLDRELPALAALALAYFAVNADKLPALFRRVGEG
jgi:hypothetical protein